jgi:hypothetical protein
MCVELGRLNAALLLSDWRRTKRPVLFVCVTQRNDGMSNYHVLSPTRSPKRGARVDPDVPSHRPARRRPSSVLLHNTRFCRISGWCTKWGSNWWCLLSFLPLRSHTNRPCRAPGLLASERCFSALMQWHAFIRLRGYPLSDCAACRVVRRCTVHATSCGCGEAALFRWETLGPLPNKNSRGANRSWQSANRRAPTLCGLAGSLDIERELLHAGYAVQHSPRLTNVGI